MYNKDWFAGKKITVMGLGLHGGGLGVAKWLLRAGAKLTITDMKTREELKKSVDELMKEVSVVAGKWGKTGQNGAKRMRFAPSSRVLPRLAPYNPRFVFGRHDEKDFINADMVIRNPAVRRENKYLQLAERNGVPVETEAALFMLLCPFQITAITGTKGKSTTTALLGEIALRYDNRSVIGGNIRISPFDALDRLLRIAKSRGKPVPVILELSSWQLEGLEKHRFSPHIGVITNVLEDHLNTYSGMDDYARAKSLNIAYQSPEDWAVVNLDDIRVAAMGSKREASMPFGGRRFPFSVRSLKGDGCFVRQGKVVLRDGRKETSVVPLSSLRIAGDHNVPNVLAACAAAHLMGIPVRTIAAGVRGFRGIEGRMQEVARKREVRYVNDTTATMPDASIAAMRAFAGKRGTRKVVLIAGGAQKGLRYADWGDAAKKYVKTMILLEGTETPTLERELKRAGFRGEVWTVDSMHHAVQVAYNMADAGDVVLLSPACSSFGMFINEFDRGDQFEREVKKLGARVRGSGGARA